MSESLATKRRNFIGKAAVLIGEPSWVLFGFFFVAAVVYGYIIASIKPLLEVSESTLGQMIVGALIYILVVGLVSLPVIMTRKREYILRVLGIHKRPGPEIWWLPFMLWVGYMIATLVASYAASFLPFVNGQETQNVGFENLTQPYEYVLAFVALVILPPVAEELLFRGYLFGRLRQTFGFWVTTIVVSVVFGIVHLQWNVGIDVAVLSIFLCYLRERTGSVWAGMVLHGIKNGLAYFLLFIAPLLGWQLLQ